MRAPPGPLPQDLYEPPASPGQRWLTVLLTVVFVLLLAGLAATLAALLRPDEAPATGARQVRTVTTASQLPRGRYGWSAGRWW